MEEPTEPSSKGNPVNSQTQEMGTLVPSVSANGTSSYEHHILEFGDETLLNIIQFLLKDKFDHCDLVSLAATCQKFDVLLQDRSLCQVIKFTWSLKTSRDILVGYLRQRTRCELLNKLQITDLYWVPSGILRDVVVQMPNLKVYCCTF